MAFTLETKRLHIRQFQDSDVARYQGWDVPYPHEKARELDLHRVIAITDVENFASFRMLDRLGFRREGHFVENLIFKGQWSSEYYYAMFEREWGNLPPTAPRA
jgi:hypothetical protein